MPFTNRLPTKKLIGVERVKVISTSGTADMPRAEGANVASSSGPAPILISIQYARAIAALLVVYAHLSGFAVFQALGLGEHGGFGVDIFFVISGFVMWQSAQRYSPTEFALRRVARIVPAYWFYTLLLVLIATFAPKLTPNINFGFFELASSLLFIPYTNFQGIQNPILLQGWTLNFEMFFYAIFALALTLRGALARACLVVAFISTTVFSGWVVPSGGAAWAMATSPILFEFVLGMAVCKLYQLDWLKTTTSIILACIGIVALASVSLSGEVGSYRALLYGIPSACLLAGLVGSEPLLARQRNGFLLTLGDTSYSLYLCHPFVLSAVAFAFKRKELSDFVSEHPIAAGVAFAICALAASTAVAKLSYGRLEQPMARRLTGFIKKREGRPHGKQGAALNSSPPR